MLPAHHTKHLPFLTYSFPPANASFHLAQSDSGHANGTGLWLGGQCLALYLASLPVPASARAIELGSGIGLTALALSSLGWHVLATDIPYVLSSVLARNISTNVSQLPPHAGVIQSRVLDWTVAPSDWLWDNPLSVASPAASSSCPNDNLLKPPFSLICSADTVYAPELVEPLLRAFHHLATQSFAISGHSPPIYLCIERRDPLLVDRLLADAKTAWQFNVNRIPHHKVSKAMKKGALSWEPSEWESIEIWKLTL
ncbi:hypothetical protein BDN72DRAFT_755954 [Pluteus cervinus]|uniref:Uncharacterized protein n=1 Tax=Pluteus cervinus TaxID=181527 RepID=A0ACD3BFU3_9AGAR|nr:hypothetical protein BDN72DRAFT_755954 [Pluteus cervinus]